MNEATSGAARSLHPRDRRLRALIGILLCLLAYLAVVLTDLWCLDNQVVSLRAGLKFLLIFSFLAFLASLVVGFKPYGKS
jgi:hypothetical protein